MRVGTKGAIEKVSIQLFDTHGPLWVGTCTDDQPINFSKDSTNCAGIQNRARN